MIVPDGFMTMAQAGERLGVTASTVRRLVRDGLLDAVLPVGRVRGMLVSEEALRRFCDGFPVASPSRPRG